MKKIFFTFLMVLTSNLIYSQLPNDYRTKYTDFNAYDWSDPDSWQIWNGSTWVNAAVSPSASNNITIRTNSYILFDDFVAECKDLTLQTNSELAFHSMFGGMQEFWVDGNVVINNGSYLSTESDGWTDAPGNFIYIAGNVINNGNINLYYEDLFSGTSIYADLAIYGSNTSFTTSIGSTTDLYSLFVLKNTMNDTLNFIYNGGVLNCQNYEDLGFLYSYEFNNPMGTFMLSGNGTLNYPLFTFGGAELVFSS